MKKIIIISFTLTVVAFFTMACGRSNVSNDAVKEKQETVELLPTSKNVEGNKVDLANTTGADWGFVLFNGNIGWIHSRIVRVQHEPNSRKVEKVLIDAPLYSQNPELARGCEVTSLAMLLNHAGLSTDKTSLAKQIHTIPFKEDGFYGNPYDGFVGNIYTLEEPGLGVYHGPIADLARQYLDDRIIDLTGNSFEAVLNQLDKGKPVWVINTASFNYVPEQYWQTWNTKSGHVRVTYKEHSVLVTGYDDLYIYFNDPLTYKKNRKVSREDFIAGWEQIGRQAISYN